MDEFNGPVIFVPGSHRAGLVRDDRRQGAKSELHLDPDDIALTAEQLADLVATHGMTSPKEPPARWSSSPPRDGTGSAPNMSRSRRLLIATYNDTTNLPSWPGEPRPEHVVLRDTRPLVPLEETFLASLDGAAR